MADVVTPEKRSRMMAGIRGQDTKPEIAIRRLLFSRGYRFRLRRKDLPGRPDIVLSKYKAVIFVHGCFWHGHTQCNLFRMPKSKQEFWNKKISGNIIRDEIAIARLLEEGWRVCTVWECALKGRNRLGGDKVINSLVTWIQDGGAQKNIRGKKEL